MRRRAMGDDDDRYPRAGRAGSRLGVYRPRLAGRCWSARASISSPG